VATKKTGKKTAVTDMTELAGDLDEAMALTPVHCTSCGYYAGSGSAGDACPTCKQPLAVAPPG